jgi:prepilin-type processing-associated H-X9-DG protein
LQNHHYPSPFGDPNSTSGSGISFECSTVRQQDVTDGCTNTIMLGEKFVDPQHYGNGADAADNENIYVGQDNDVYRGTGSPPMQDRWGVVSSIQFGSAHFTSANFAFCDGSIHAINYAVDATTYHNLGNRRDGLSVDLSKL